MSHETIGPTASAPIADELDLDASMTAAWSALRAIGVDTDATEISWLSGGGAHKNFLVNTAGADRAVLKVWNTTWEGFGVMSPAPVIFANTAIAGDLGIGAKVLGVSRDPLALLLEYIPSTPLDRTQPRWTAKLAGATRKLHDSGARFNNDYSPFAEARKMLASAQLLGGDIPHDVRSLRSVITDIERVLDLRCNDFVPCHNDLYGPNILETPSGEVRIIDYDLAGNGDRCYDLGFSAAYFEMDADVIHQYVENYFGEADPHLVARVRLLAIAADWAALALWTVAESAADTNDDYDYAGERRSSLRRINSSLGSAWFGRALQQAKR